MALILVKHGEKISHYRLEERPEVMRIWDQSVLRRMPYVEALQELWSRFADAYEAAYPPRSARARYGLKAFTDYLGIVRVGGRYGRPRWPVREVVFCAQCGLPEWDTSAHWLPNRRPVCRRCLQRDFRLCRTCGVYYHRVLQATQHQHDVSACCTSPAVKFSVPANGGLLASDTKATVTLPDGVIDDEGITLISDALREYGYPRGLATRAGTEWQTNRGSYTKRLGKAAHDRGYLPLPGGLTAVIGGIARDHSKPVSMRIMVSRQLNRSSAWFYHQGSCWWGSYRSSRCVLKTNGGFALLSYPPEGNSPSGRAWVLPLRAGQPPTRFWQGITTHDPANCETCARNYESYAPSRGMRATFDTLTAEAFLIFNGYGALAGYAAPRVLAYLTGWSYAKLSVDISSEMYLNASTGYLVAPQETLSRLPEIRMRLDRHSNLFNEENKEREAG